jgi:hypothetical protein
LSKDVKGLGIASAAGSQRKITSILPHLPNDINSFFSYDNFRDSILFSILSEYLNMVSNLQIELSRLEDKVLTNVNKCYVEELKTIEHGTSVENLSNLEALTYAQFEK